MNAFLTKMENAPKQPTADGSHQTDENYIDTLEQRNSSLSITKDLVKNANSQAHPDPESKLQDKGPASRFLSAPGDFDANIPLEKQGCHCRVCWVGPSSFVD